MGGSLVPLHPSDTSENVSREAGFLLLTSCERCCTWVSPTPVQNLRPLHQVRLPQRCSEGPRPKTPMHLGLCTRREPAHPRTPSRAQCFRDTVEYSRTVLLNPAGNKVRRSQTFFMFKTHELDRLCLDPGAASSQGRMSPLPRRPLPSNQQVPGHLPGRTLVSAILTNPILPFPRFLFSVFFKSRSAPRLRFVFLRTRRDNPSCLSALSAVYRETLLIQKTGGEAL